MPRGAVSDDASLSRCLDRTGLRPGNCLLFDTHRARGGLAETKVQDNPLTINNNVTTAPYPNPPSLNQILHASKEQLSRSLPLDRR
jgi:hypothetical protein